MSFSLKPRSTRWIVLGGIVGLANVAAWAAMSPSIDEWKAAVANMGQTGKGPETIPYSDLSRDARDAQDKVNATKELVKSFDDLKTKAHREQIANMSKKVAQLKEDLTKVSGELEFAEKGLATDLKDIDLRLANCMEALKARHKVRETFEKAIDQAGRESDPDIQAEAAKLIPFWKDGNDKHEEELDKLEDMVAFGQKCKSGDE